MLEWLTLWRADGSGDRSGKAHELAAHRRAEELHEEAAVTLERLGRRDLAQAARERAQQARELHALALREQAEADERATGQHGE